MSVFVASRRFTSWLDVLWRLGAVIGLTALGVPLVGTVASASAALPCPTKVESAPMALPGGGCSEEAPEEERLQREDERLEEEIERREDGREEEALAAERAARAAKDAAEEEAAEANEQTAQSRNAAYPGNGTAQSLVVAVHVRVRNRRRRSQRYETIVSVVASEPARVTVSLRTHGRQVRLDVGRSARGLPYSLRIAWPCRTRARRYTFTVIADSDKAAQPGVGTRVVRRGTLTVKRDRGCLAKRPVSLTIYRSGPGTSPA